MSETWVSHQRDRTWRSDPPSGAVAEFNRALPGYAPTTLVELLELASELGVGRVFAKDESDRLGLPAFKALGASWAVRRALHLRGDRPTTLVTATDGNHGRAVAHFARLLGHSAAIYVPAGLHPLAVQAIEGEGARVTVVDGSYDDAVAAAAQAGQRPGAVLVQDMAWEGYEEIPGWIVEGYDTMLVEIDNQLATAGFTGPDLIAVPTGVGSLLQAVLTHYRNPAAPAQPAVVAVEPLTAACIAASLAAGRLVSVDAAPTIMAGLNCGTPSTLAWPLIVRGVDGAAAVSEAGDIRAAHDLADLGVHAGPCGAASLAAMRDVLTGPGSLERRRHLQIDYNSTLVLLVTEGSDSNPVPELPSDASS